MILSKQVSEAEVSTRLLAKDPYYNPGYNYPRSGEGYGFIEMGNYFSTHPEERSPVYITPVPFDMTLFSKTLFKPLEKPTVLYQTKLATHSNLANSILTSLIPYPPSSPGICGSLPRPADCLLSQEHGFQDFVELRPKLLPVVNLGYDMFAYSRIIHTLIDLIYPDCIAEYRHFAHHDHYNDYYDFLNIPAYQMQTCVLANILISDRHSELPLEVINSVRNKELAEGMAPTPFIVCFPKKEWFQYPDLEGVNWFNTTDLYKFAEAIISLDHHSTF